MPRGQNPSSVPAPRSILALFVFATQTTAAAPVAAQRAAEPAFSDARGDLTLALTGDAILTRRLSVYQEPEFLSLRELIRTATAAFTNLEVLFHDYEEDVIPAARSGGTYMRAEPELAKELVWMGFDLVSRANNHTMDFGVGGLRHTTRAVEAAGLVHAGAGENLALARAPAYLETPGGRVALVSVASTFAEPMRAGGQRKDVRGRPGLSPIRYRTRYIVPRERFETLKEIVEEGLRRGRARGDSLFLFGSLIVPGEGYARRTEPDPRDLEEVLAVVREASRQAEWVIVSSHSHEGGESRDVPAEFLETFARATIEAGADLFVGHGPHVLRGIEIYRGRPIFYSLANFVFQNETVLLQPADNYLAFDLGPEALPGEFQDARIEATGGGFPANPAYWESVVALASFRAGELVEVGLHPVSLGYRLDRSVRGRPVLAGPALAQKILDRVARLSEPYGTRINVRDGVGVIRP